MRTDLHYTNVILLTHSFLLEFGCAFLCALFCYYTEACLFLYKKCLMIFFFSLPTLKSI